MKQDNLVSIIMPMYNSERFVAESIDSVIAQTYDNWELLIIDDGSKDKSVDIVREYEAKDSRIHLLFNEQHTGMPSRPRNVGIEKAAGRFIAFLDSDDVWLRDKLAQQVILFEDNRTALAFSNYEKIDENSRRSARIIKAPAIVDYPYLLYGNVIGNLTGVFDVSKVGKNYFLEIHHEDYAFWLSILKKGYIARNTGTITALYREHSGSISSNKWRNLGWQWNIYRKIEHVGVLRSAWYFAFYSMKAFYKSMV